MSGGRASPVVPAGAHAPSTDARLAGQVRAGVERPAGSHGRLPPRAPRRRRAQMTPNRHGSAVIELPNELDVVMTRKFDAPIALVFDVLTKAEHVSRWFAPFSCQRDGVLDRPTRRRGLPHGVRDRGRSRVLVPRHLPRGRAADADRRDVAVRRVARRARRRDGGTARSRRCHDDDPERCRSATRPAATT